jgi:hypothetical protein
MIIDTSDVEPYLQTSSALIMHTLLAHTHTRTYIAFLPLSFYMHPSLPIFRNTKLNEDRNNNRTSIAFSSYHR